MAPTSLGSEYAAPSSVAGPVLLTGCCCPRARADRARHAVSGADLNGVDHVIAEVVVGDGAIFVAEQSVGVGLGGVEFDLNRAPDGGSAPDNRVCTGGRFIERGAVVGVASEEHPVLYDEDLAFIHARGFGELAAAAVAALIPRLRARAVRRVVDVGCGAGVSTRALVDAGFDTFALEPSRALLEVARRAAPGARFEQGSAYEVALEACDAVLAIGEVLSYHAPSDDAEARIQSFFDVARRALSTGGLLIFDLIETGQPSLTTRAWKAGDEWAVLSASNEDVGKETLVREIQTFRYLEGGLYRRHAEMHHVRVFARGAVTAWLEQAGFEVEVATAYGAFELPVRRVAFFAVRQ